ncbi:MAG: selenocysteine-specific translation elongation factor [Clostridiales Family XIII bacterium]|uniref:Selenocysteine-specific elongation factor n=1 Tax=Hominibacterium faecale TaxID=2839743 RepID=A0A9J6QSQ4_9FIRM|nr:selenocysteine-specific translation elongation factor [Hominibacterium faecale]MCI7304370.1 selenocysteine-specific translation elongation factor [Clostridia bacterium]MCU7379061.1 selenocysteine-specific translation elongation factor [Hominibacterium faecale]MDY3011361.1 selenocysteine-specific translation elongation factor [Clostridiales Family XIII bacterium]
MKNVIIGTAGHIDHGKTCLIKALTQIDTDRLKEEKQRGITIELGFADLPNDMDLDIGIIDVPGHEKFVKHMLAGIGGIDIVLLIVAADEGFMPQTKEHFEILKMLKIKKGIVVMTKADLADEEWREVVKEDIKDNVAGTFLEGAPIMEVSSYTGQGIEELKKQILEMAAQCGSRREDRRLLRLPIDRVFTIDGFGTVITGTLMEGSVGTGDEVLLYPSQKKAKVRNIQVHGNTVTEARAGQRTAINLAGIKKEELNRGDVAAYPGLLENTRMIDVRIDMFDRTKRILKSGSRLHFYYGSAEALCKAVLLDQEAIGEGESCYAQLRFEEEIAVKRGDRFILRFYSPLETIGGGKILDAAAKKKKRFSEEAIASLKIQDEGKDQDVLAQIFLEESFRLGDLAEVIRKLGKTKEEAEELVDALLEEKTIKKISENLLLHKTYLSDVQSKAKALLENYHRENPVSSGMPKEEFRGKLGRLLRTEDQKKLELLINDLLQGQAVKEEAGTMSLRDFQVTYTEEQKKMADRLGAIYEKAGLEPPLTQEVAAGEKDPRLAGQILGSMHNRGVLGRLNYQYYMDAAALKSAIDVLINTIDRQGKITLAQYRDLIGTSRKYAVMILEYADENKITKMTGDCRVLYRQED